MLIYGSYLELNIEPEVIIPPLPSLHKNKTARLEPDATGDENEFRNEKACGVFTSPSLSLEPNAPIPVVGLAWIPTPKVCRLLHSSVTHHSLR